MKRDRCVPRVGRQPFALLRVAAHVAGLASLMLALLAALATACSLDFGALQRSAPLPLEGGPADAADGVPTDGGDAATTSDATRPDAGSPVDGGRPDGGCPALEERPVRRIHGEVVDNQTWRCDTRYLLDAATYVTGGATLTLEPGTVVEVSRGAFLAVLPDARIEAVGTATAPVVLTSARPVGSRAPGDWTGLELLGSAPVEWVNPVLLGDPRLAFGGDDPEHDCGRLRYVRIEFAGTTSSDAALQLAGCGRLTELDSVQVHLAGGTGLNLRGGTVDLRHVLVHGASDGGFAWDLGWRGRAQHVVVETSRSSGPLLSGVVADTARAEPFVFNVTLAHLAPTSQSAGMFFGLGTNATVRDALVLGRFGAVVDVADPQSVERTSTDPPTLVVSHSMFFGMGDAPSAYVTTELPPVGDGGFDEATWLATPELSNRFGVDPELGDLAPTAPALVPPLGSPAGRSTAAPPDDGFFEPATYVGAFEPGGEDWRRGWTAYPPS